jgi:hypothetical protein
VEEIKLYLNFFTHSMKIIPEKRGPVKREFDNFKSYIDIS